MDGNRGRGAVLIAAIAGLTLAFVASASSCDSKPQDPTSRANPKLRTVELAVGSVRIQAEVALTEDERARGLMYRKNLDDGTGMLFAFENDQILAFWMKNTTLPLSLAYLSSEGRIVQILELDPLSLASMSSERSVRYALEVPRGYFERAGIAVGDRIEIPALR